MRNGLWNKVYLSDVVDGLKKIEDKSVDCVLIDPPYNIGYDFGNNECRKEMKEYVAWANEWISESQRILKDTGTMFIYGFSEILAHISVSLDMNHRWLIWHYTNKTTPSSKFWQRTHEAIICAWKDKDNRLFNVDDVREPYTENFIKGYKGKGKKRPGTSGRFGSKGTTVYEVNEKGALPRDVIKVSALAGGAGAKSRISFCRDCQVSILGRKEGQQHKDHDVVKHPTQKPFQLTKRLLMSCMPENGRVVIPFVGTGSECLIAKKLNFDYIGFDLNPDFVKMANDVVGKDIEL
tara:strand:- start:2580 stop:3458 length:879 start_codon:yes stop_codon:yes gene_type:complete